MIHPFTLFILRWLSITLSIYSCNILITIVMHFSTNNSTLYYSSEFCIKSHTHSRKKSYYYIKIPALPNAHVAASQATASRWAWAQLGECPPHPRLLAGPPGTAWGAWMEAERGVLSEVTATPLLTAACLRSAWHCPWGWPGARPWRGWAWGHWYGGRDPSLPRLSFLIEKSAKFCDSWRIFY